ncbi:hypothetical protein N7456_002908 [Penicillium angulare]|uniref:Zn(2)-C6 fungal-type domain-containing protein n=1 Tax=Penicillium angulare TaxID=116970 RepID=A0A9W9FTS3_9EURO|nr:hypothetical protein N7456_002908 [Penicillium angulare]
MATASTVASGNMCDESRPICSHCIASERSCFYSDEPIRTRTPIQRGSSTPSVTPRSPFEPSAESLEDVSAVNMMHVELLHHLFSDFQNVVENDYDQSQVSFVDISKHFLSAPYLMNMALALSALHLSITRPDQRQLYRHRASHMQMHALSIFNAMKPVSNPDSCIPLFLFSSLLGVHMLCDSLAFHSDAFEEFLASYTQSIRLHQGVRTVINGSWEFLRQTELAPFLNVADSINMENFGISDEFQTLLGLLQSANLEESVSKTYHDSIMSLQGVTTAALSHPTSNVHIIHAWPVIVGADYVDLLSSHQPEALVILAHYAVLLHLRRDNWMFGDGGKYLIESISQFLGPAWENWLSWPVKNLQDGVL